MNNIPSKIILTMALLSISLTICAQQHHIKIFVVDDHHIPLDYFNVMIINPSDSTDLHGEVFYNGNLAYQVNMSGHKLMTISSLGYKDYPLNIDFDNLTYPDTIAMQTVALQIGKIMVEGKRKAVKIEKGNAILQIAGSSLANLSDISAIMSRAPGVKASENDLTVLGRGAPLIYIDGKQSTYSDLKVLQPANILSIEVDRNPSARYDASAKAVMRVRTIRAAEGVSGRIYFGVDVAQQVSPTAGGQLQINTPKLYTFLGVDFATPWYKKTCEFNQNIVMPEYAMTDNAMTNTLEKHTSTNFLYNSVLTTSLRSKLSWQYRLGYNEMNTDESVVEKIEGIVMPLENIFTSINGTSRQPNHKINIGYQVDFDSINKLEIFGDYSLINSNQTQNIEQLNTDTQEITKLKINNRNNADVANFRAEYTTQIANANFIVGTDYGFINNRSSVDYNGELSNINTKSHLFSLYTTFGNDYEKWGYEVGLRYEYLNDRLILAADRVTNRIEHKLFPAVDIHTNELWTNFNMAFSYASHTTRPSLNDLNPSKSYMNKVTIWQGNPNLLSTIEHNLSLNFTMWGNLSLDLEYNITSHSNLTTGILAENKKSIIFTPVNIAHASDFNTMLSYSNEWKFFSLSAAAILFVPNYKIPYLDGFYDNNIVSCMFSVAPGFKISKNTDLSFNYMYGSRNSVLMAVAEPAHDLSVNFSQYLFKRRVQIVASAANLLNKSDSPIRDKMGYYESYNNSNYGTKRFTLSIRYIFNNFKSKYRGYGEFEQNNRVK